VTIDAELGIVLRHVSYVADRPAIRFELRDLSFGNAGDPGDFGLAIPPGMPVIESSGGPLHDLDLPAPVQAAGAAAGALLDGAASAASWLRRRLSL
jgi:hypothetical protein